MLVCEHERNARRAQRSVTMITCIDSPRTYFAKPHMKLAHFTATVCFSRIKAVHHCGRAHSGRY